jgi:hypothetical protein
MPPKKPKPAVPRPTSPSINTTIDPHSPELPKMVSDILERRGAAILVSRQLPPLEDDVALLNEEIEVLYEYITHRYTIPMDMLIVLFGVAINIGHESFDQHAGKDAGTTPDGTLHRLLGDLIKQYVEGKKKRVM